jgi:hypothetical protein
VALTPAATFAAAAMVAAPTIETCARIWSAFHSPGFGVVSVSDTAAAASRNTR